MPQLLNDAEMIERIFDHMDSRTTDTGDVVWREPTENYRSQARFEAELALLRRTPVPFCPSAALPENGSYVARIAAGTPLVVVRDPEGVVRAFVNVCRHRGMQVAKGAGCAKGFVCPYHGWAYGLDGQLKHIPGKEGFPGVDPQTHGLREVSAAEKGGLVYVNQENPISADELADVPDLIAPDQALFDQAEFEDEANWKLIAESVMEGYHIKSLHRTTFYPYGLDNINVVELFGNNARITFPFRRIESLRDVEPGERRIEGMVTYLYKLFPNAHIAVLSKHASFVVLEPVSPSRTRYVVYSVMGKSNGSREISVEDARRDAEFVAKMGLEEDREATRAIQEGLASNANSHLTFGHFEKAIAHFHKNLAARIDS